jgi:phage gp36-like protein
MHLRKLTAISLFVCPAPLPNTPSTLERIGQHCTRYRLYFQQPIEEVENRYKAEIDFLKRVADGKATLNILNHVKMKSQKRSQKRQPQQCQSVLHIVAVFLVTMS